MVTTNPANATWRSASNPWSSGGSSSSSGGGGLLASVAALEANQGPFFGKCDCQESTWDDICRQSCQGIGGIGCSGEKPKVISEEDPWGSEASAAAKKDPCQYVAITSPNVSGGCTGLCSCKTPSGTQVSKYDYDCKKDEP